MPGLLWAWATGHLAVNRTNAESVLLFKQIRRTFVVHTLTTTNHPCLSGKAPPELHCEGLGFTS